MRIRTLPLFLLCGLTASAQVSTNKIFVVNTNNVLPPNVSNFFYTNITLLTNALTNVGYGLGGGGGGGSFSGTNIQQLNATNQLSANSIVARQSAGGTFTAAWVPSNQVYSSSAFVSPLINGVIQEATGAQTDGTNIYVCYNDFTNGIGVYIETHNGLGTAPLGPVVASNYLYGTTASAFTTAGGMSYYQGQLYCCVGTNFAPSLGNAVAVFNTNCVLQGIHPLGQAPNFVQFFQPVSPTLALAVYFASPYQGSASPAGSQLPWFTVGSATTGTPWLTNGNYVPLSEVTDMEGIALDPSGNAWTYGISDPLVFEPPYNLQSAFSSVDGGVWQISEVNTNTGAVTVVSYPQTTNALMLACGQITGSCFFWSNDYTRLNVVAQGANDGPGYASPNTNFILSFSTVSSTNTNSAQINSGGMVKAPMAAFGRLTAASGIVSNTSVLAAPVLSVKGYSTLDGLLTLQDTSAGLASTNVSMKADTSANLYLSVPTGQAIFMGPLGSGVTVAGGGFNSTLLFQPYGGMANVASLAGQANCIASVSNLTASNIVATNFSGNGGNMTNLQPTNLAADGAANGQVLTYDNAAGRWYPSNAASGSLPTFSAQFNSGGGKTNIANGAEITNLLVDTAENMTNETSVLELNFNAQASEQSVALNWNFGGANVWAIDASGPVWQFNGPPGVMLEMSPSDLIAEVPLMIATSNIFTATASSFGQITVYNYFPSSALTPTNCAYDWRSGPCYMASSSAGFLIVTNTWLYPPGAGTNEIVTTSFTLATAYTAANVGASTFTSPGTAIFTNGPTQGGIINVPGSLGGLSAAHVTAVAGLTGWSIWATNGAANAGRTVAYGHAENQ